MTKSVEISEYHFGVSNTFGGEKVLTPFGYVGSAYEFKRNLYVIYRQSMLCILCLMGVFSLVIIFANSLKHLSAIAMIGLIALGLVMADAARYLVVKLIFRKSTKLSVRDPIVRATTNIFDRMYGPIFFLKPQYILYVFVALGGVFIVNVFDNILNSSSSLKGSIVSLIFNHIVIYAVLYSKVGKNR